MVACSRYVQRLFRGIPLVPGSRIEFAYNSVQAAPIGQKSAAARAARPAGGVFRAIMVATLEAHKDHATLLRAAKILVDRAVRFELFIVGAGRLETALKELAHSLGLGDSVRFLGARADVPELLGQCDLFVLSTTPQEGRPGVILEALAAGLPIVASDVAPLREVLEDGRWGQLVPPANPELLAAAMEVALPSALAERDNRGPAEARRAYALGFSPERMLGDYLRLARRGAVAPSLS
jgi:glycosyltransferase involved in cell wall biosynthesis